MGSDQQAESVVRGLCEAFAKHDAQALREFFTDDVVYHNIPLDPAVGIEATMAFIEGFFGMCESMTIETLHLAVRGNVVLTERIDQLLRNDGTVITSAPVAGVLEFEGRQVVAWREHFNAIGFAGQIPRNMLLRRRLST